MEFDPKSYSRLNRPHREDAEATIRQVLQDGLGDVKTIVDMGCGSGNVTRLVADAIAHERLIAIDIDAEMIQFARANKESNNRMNSTPEFLVQDINVPFDQWDPRLRELEGSVDLVMSNHVLHWIPETGKAEAAKNVLRLLKAGGRAYMNIAVIPDILQAVQDCDRRKAVAKFLRVPSFQEQEESWRRSFQSAGASDFTVTFQQRSHNLGNNDDLQSSRHFVKTDLYRNFLSKTMTREVQVKFLETLEEEFLRCFAGPLGDPLPTDEVFTATEFCYGVFHVIVTK